MAQRHQCVLLIGNDTPFFHKVRGIILHQGYKLVTVFSLEDGEKRSAEADLVVCCDDFPASGTDLKWAEILYSVGEGSFEEKTLAAYLKEHIGPPKVEVLL